MSAYTPRTGTAGASRSRWQLHRLGESADLVRPMGRWRPARGACLVLAFLALEGPTPRERLAALLWPERPESRARALLDGLRSELSSSDHITSFTRVRDALLGPSAAAAR